MNVIAQLEFKMAYFMAVVQHFTQYTMGTPHWSYRICQLQRLSTGAVEYAYWKDSLLGL